MSPSSRARARAKRPARRSGSLNSVTSPSSGTEEQEIHRLIILHSDGRLKAPKTERSKVEEDNGPTEEQYKRRKGANGVWSWYQEVDVDDLKHVDWRRKLAGMLLDDMREKKRLKGELPTDGRLSDAEYDPEKYILAAFPTNYRLFEHRRQLNPDNPDMKDKNDRRDAYLYGHPGGRRKRFRSPLDFFPHLIWLSEDKGINPDNCACKLCVSDEFTRAAEEMGELQKKLFPADGATTADGPATADEPATANGPATVDGASDVEVKTAQGRPSIGAQRTASTDSVVSQNASVSRPAKTLPKELLQAQINPPKLAAKPTPKPQIAVTKPGASVPHIAPIPPGIPTAIPLIPPKDLEQALDQKLNSFLYRNGELVWYRRESGAVGLAAVIARDLQRDNAGKDQPAYALQPLSHPYEHPPLQIVEQENRIVPWLAYSTPNCQHEFLRTFTGTYDEIDWQAVLNGAYGDGDCEVDGSITAAKTVDSTYTLLQPLTPLAESVNEISYNAIFLGGEKVWVGEAIRLHIGSGKDVMIVSRIVETVQPLTSNTVKVEMVGDVYTLSTATHNPTRPRPANHYLPVRLNEDLKARNAPRVRTGNDILYWKFVQAQARVSISQIKGRWYESARVLPIISTRTIEENIKRGLIPDVGDSLNSRGGSLADGSIGIKKEARLWAFSRSLPPGTRFDVSLKEIRNAMQAPQASGNNNDNGGSGLGTDGVFNTPQNMQQQQQQVDTDMSEFVNEGQMGDNEYGNGYMTSEM